MCGDCFRRLLERVWPETGAPSETTRLMEPSKAFVVCVRPRDSAILLLEAFKRKKGKHFQLPGGRVDPGESALSGALRELREETSLIVDSKRAKQVCVLEGRAYFFVELSDDQAESIHLSNEHVGFAWETDVEKASRDVALHSKGFGSFALLEARRTNLL